MSVRAAASLGSEAKRTPRRRSPWTGRRKNLPPARPTVAAPTCHRMSIQGDVFSGLSASTGAAPRAACSTGFFSGPSALPKVLISCVLKIVKPTASCVLFSRFPLAIRAPRTASPCTLVSSCTSSTAACVRRTSAATCGGEIAGAAHPAAVGAMRAGALLRASSCLWANSLLRASSWRRCLSASACFAVVEPARLVVNRFVVTFPGDEGVVGTRWTHRTRSSSVSSRGRSSGASAAVGTCCGSVILVKAGCT
jgi:hypothetical protein